MCRIYMIMAIISLCDAKSYFFSAEESRQILNKLKEDYKLSSIFYISKLNWIVWINGKPYTEIGKYKTFSINKVTPTTVAITLNNGKNIILKMDAN